MLSFFIFILNAFLLFFSVDFDALDTVQEQIKLSLFLSILLLSLVLFITIFKKKRFLQKIFYKISLLEKNEDVEKALD